MKNKITPEETLTVSSLIEAGITPEWRIPSVQSARCIVSDSNEWRVIGPPGTGKTTYLSHQVARSVQAGRRPLITSLTKAAATEIASRVEVGWDFSSDQVGTLHSHCFRALGSPTLISKAEHVEDWNHYCASANPAWALSLKTFVSRGGEEDAPRGGIGDGTYASYCILRSRMTPEELWPIELLSFGRKFREWRLLSSLMDFTDLIETAWRDRVAAPWNPDVVFVDEAQDHDRLELSLVRQWAANVDRLVVCGDPDQNLYSFRGADPAAFYATEIPDDHYITLSQSYRVPRAVHAAAQRLIGRVRDRRVVEYHPRDFDGVCVQKAHLRLRAVHEVGETISKVADSGRSVMVLASCEFQLHGLIKFLRDAGIPFHNPFAANRGSFNPLGDRAGITSPQRLLAFLRSDERYFADARRWTWKELDVWVDPLDVSGVFRRGAKKKIEELGRSRAEQMVDGPTLRELLEPNGGAEALAASRDNPLAWFESRINKSRAAAFAFPLAVAQRRGVAALTEEPRIILGTVHSVKGGEADVVYVFPDLSPQGAESYARDPDSIWRLFYVAATRAKEELYLCGNSSGSAVIW